MTQAMHRIGESEMVRTAREGRIASRLRALLDLNRARRRARSVQDAARVQAAERALNELDFSVSYYARISPCRIKD